VCPGDLDAGRLGEVAQAAGGRVPVHPGAACVQQDRQALYFLGLCQPHAHAEALAQLRDQVQAADAGSKPGSALPSTG
jgi:5,10-methylenetetrahydrofolate reductase